MKFVAVLFLWILKVVDVANVAKLKTTPIGVKYADLDKYMGKWYVYANIHPCTWKGAVKFTDWTHTYMLDDTRQQFIIKNQWRKDGTCSNTEEICTPTSPSSYTVEDRLGDLWSGTVVIVAMDKHFQHYVIRWGCVKYLGDMCADYWASVKTRNPHPTRDVIDTINRKLAELWDTSLLEMDAVPHTYPCDPPSHPAPKSTRAKYYATY